MSKAKLNKVLAGMLAATMVLGMSMTAFAADTTTGDSTGTGTFEGHVNKDIKAVKLPTDVPATTFAYTMDPEGLIAATNHAKNPNASYEENANVYFLSDTDTYTKDSAKLKVVNKGTVDVDVTIKAETAANGKVTMADSATFAESDTAAKLYLGLKVADKPEAAIKAAADGVDPTAVTVGLKGRPGNYEITYAENKYQYTAKNVPETAWNSFEFGLTGACNAKGDWSDEDLAGSNVTVTWSYVEHPETGGADMLTENATTDVAPSIEQKEYVMQEGQDIVISVNLGTGSLAATEITSITYTNSSGAERALDSQNYTLEGNTLTIKGAYINTVLGANVTSRDYTIKFNKGSDIKVTFKAQGQ